MTTRILCAAALALLTLAACDSKQDDRATLGQKVDQAVASAKTAAADVKQTAAQGLDRAAEMSQEKSAEISQKAQDAAITAAIDAGLAKDPQLSALRIDVDTHEGKVSLQGVAPNEAAKQRAQMIAQNEKGVTAVENKLTIEPK